MDGAAASIIPDRGVVFEALHEPPNVWSVYVCLIEANHYDASTNSLPFQAVSIAKPRKVLMLSIPFGEKSLELDGFLRPCQTAPDPEELASAIEDYTRIEGRRLRNDIIAHLEERFGEA